jgi:hypothetical protein
VVVEHHVTLKVLEVDGLVGHVVPEDVEVVSVVEGPVPCPVLPRGDALA